MARIEENTASKINNIIDSDKERKTALKLLEKCKKADKGKREYPVPNSPVKTWFICKTKAKAEKRIAEFKRSLIVRV